MRIVKKLATIGALLLMVSACGQRGPLYLPEQTPTSNQSEQAVNETPSNSNVDGGRR